MTPADVLSLTAELSLGLAGFAGVVVILGGGPGQWSAADHLRIRLLLIGVFAVLFSSLVPLGAVASGCSLDVSLGIGSLIMFAFVYWWFFEGREVRSMPRADPDIARLLNARLRVLYIVLGLLASLAQLAGIAAAFWGVDPFPFLFVGLLWGLFVGAFGFVRILFIRPDSP